MYSLLLVTSIFWNKSRFQSKVFLSKVYDTFISFDDFAIVTVKGYNHSINFWFLTKSNAVDKMKNTDLSEQSGQLQIKKKKMFPVVR